MSKIKVDQIEGGTGSTITIPTGQTLTVTDGLAASTISSGTLADARIPNLNASKINAGTLPVARGGTGLTSLGTANQVLAVNSGASALEFQNVASDFVKLVSTSFSNVSSMSLDGYYSSTYNNYRVIINNFYANSGADVHFSFNTGGSQIADTSYKSRVGRITSATALDASGQDGAKYRLWYGGSGNAGESTHVTIDIYNPLDTTGRHIMSYRGGSYTSSGNLYHFFGSAEHSTLQAHSGFTIDNFTSGYGTLTMYGIK